MSWVIILCGFLALFLIVWKVVWFVIACVRRDVTDQIIWEEGIDSEEKYIVISDRRNANRELKKTIAEKKERLPRFVRMEKRYTRSLILIILELIVRPFRYKQTLDRIVQDTLSQKKDA